MPPTPAGGATRTDRGRGIGSASIGRTAGLPWLRTGRLRLPARVFGWAGPWASALGSWRPLGQRSWQWLVGAFGTLTLLAVCGLSSFFILVDERRGREATATEVAPVPTALPRDISSRLVDPEPLTPAEVFPEPEISINRGEAPYRVLKTQSSPDCRTAAAGELGKLLSRMGCDQVIRGTLRSPNGAYLVTAGIFNLADADGADRAHREIKTMIPGGRGRFQGMAAGAGTEPVVLSSAQVGWHVRGHFLAYCVIARADGAEIAADDPFARQILYDMVELHLRGEILGRRASVPVDAPGVTTAAPAVRTPR